MEACKVLLGLAAVVALVVLLGLFNGLGLWGALWTVVFAVLPLALIGFAFLGKRWFTISSRTGRRL